MLLKKLVTIIGLLALSTMAFASTSELASRVISIKIPTINDHLTQYNKRKSTEVFMELINHGSQSHTLVAAFSPIAKQVQLHMSTIIDGKMGMRQINGIIINKKPNNEDNLHKGGLHVMLIGLTKPLKINQMVPVTLIFHDGSWITIRARVRS